MKRVTPEVPTILRVFFMIQFLINVLISVPLFIFPDVSLDFVGWILPIDPVIARLVAAALFAMGVESLIASRGTNDTFVSVLNLNSIWSFFAACGSLISIADLSWHAPVVLWVVSGYFFGLCVLWTYWRVRLI